MRVGRGEDVAPLTVPVWYSYEPGGEIRIITARRSRKGQLLERAGRFSLCAQTETLPYKYVSVEGPIVTIEEADLERDRRPLARRYLGAEGGDRYIESTRHLVGNVLVRMRPERWLSVDYAKRAIVKRHADDLDAYYDIKDPVYDLIWEAARDWSRQTNWTPM